jgi:hypothetical protein
MACSCKSTDAAQLNSAFKSLLKGDRHPATAQPCQFDACAQHRNEYRIGSSLIETPADTVSKSATASARNSMASWSAIGGLVYSTSVAVEKGLVPRFLDMAVPRVWSCTSRLQLAFPKLQPSAWRIVQAAAVPAPRRVSPLHGFFDASIEVWASRSELSSAAKMAKSPRWPRIRHQTHREVQLRFGYRSVFNIELRRVRTASPACRSGAPAPCPTGAARSMFTASPSPSRERAAACLLQGSDQQAVGALCSGSLRQDA